MKKITSKIEVFSEKEKKKRNKEQKKTKTRIVKIWFLLSVRSFDFSYALWHKNHMNPNKTHMK